MLLCIYIKASLYLYTFTYLVIYLDNQLYTNVFIFLYIEITKLLYIYIISIINHKTLIISISQIIPRRE